MNEAPKPEQAPVAETEAVLDEAELSDDQLEGVAGRRVARQGRASHSDRMLERQGF